MKGVDYCYHLLCIKAKQLSRAEVKWFVRFYLDRVAVSAQQLGYVPLSKAHLEVARKHIEDEVFGAHGTLDGGGPSTFFKRFEAMKTTNDR